jgi:type I restriction enzyme, S subunit
MMPVIENNERGSIFKKVSDRTLNGIKILIISRKVIEAFTKKGSPVFRKPENLQNQNQKFFTFRDWLLPMLMNGQVSITEAEERVEEELGMVAEGRESYKKE